MTTLDIVLKDKDTHGCVCMNAILVLDLFLLLQTLVDIILLEKANDVHRPPQVIKHTIGGGPTFTVRVFEYSRIDALSANTLLLPVVCHISYTRSTSYDI